MLKLRGHEYAKEYVFYTTQKWLNVYQIQENIWVDVETMIQCRELDRRGLFRFPSFFFYFSLFSYFQWSQFINILNSGSKGSYPPYLSQYRAKAFVAFCLSPHFILQEDEIKKSLLKIFLFIIFRVSGTYRLKVLQLQIWSEQYRVEEWTDSNPHE